MLSADNTSNIAVVTPSEQKVGGPISCMELSILSTTTFTVSSEGQPPPAFETVRIYSVFIVGNAIGFAMFGSLNPVVGDQLYT